MAVSCNYRFIPASDYLQCVSTSVFLQARASGFMIVGIIGLFRVVMVTSLRRPRLLAASDQSQRHRYIENWDSSGECMNLH